MTFLRFALPTTPAAGHGALVRLREIFARAGVDEVEPVFVPSYAALYDAVHLHDADAAWCPPLVARDLQRVAAADPVATVLRGGADHYFSAFVVGPSFQGSLADLGTARAGWVSRMSAAGYIVPRNHLRASGVELAFREERFFNTHARSMAALAAGAVDFVATYAAPADGKARVHDMFDGARVLESVGPVPGDVLIVTRGVPAALAQAVGAALRDATLGPGDPFAALTGASAFGTVPSGHLESLARWIDEPVFGKPHPPPAPP